MDQETFRPSIKKPELPKPEVPKVETKDEMDELDFSKLPPLVAKALFKNKEKLKKFEDEETPHQGPRVAFTGNDKLDALIEGAKEQIFNYDELLLPSLGKFYDGSQAPTNGVIHIRPMTGHEEEILATQKYIKSGTALNMIFRNVIREPIKPELLLSIDRTVILVYLRGISYGSDYEVETKCPNCGNKLSHTIDLDKPVNPCPQDFNENNLIEIMPVTGYRFSYRLATGQDDSIVSKYREQRMKRGDNVSDDTSTYRSSILINSIEDPKSGIRIDDQRSIQILLSRLPIADLNMVRNTINDPPFGLDTKCEVECNCGEEFDIELPMETSFFFPRKKKKMTNILA